MNYARSSRTKVPAIETKGTLFSIGVITADKSKSNSVQKKIDFIDGRAVKDGSHRLNICSGRFDDRTVSGMAGLSQLIKGIGKNQALTLGVCGSDQTQRIVTSKVYAQGTVESQIARTKDCLDFSKDNAFFLLLDVDDEPGKPKLTPFELMALLTSLIPEFGTVGTVVTQSTSSNIYHKESGKCLLGEGNYHVFAPARGNVNRLIEVLKVKFWAAGKGFFKLATPNKQTGVAAVLERFPIDMAVFSGERLVYEAGALLPNDLEQRRGEPAVTEGTVLDLDAIVATEEEKARAKINKDKAKEKITSTRLDQAVKNVRSIKPDLSDESAKKEVKRLIESVESGVLARDHKLFLKDGATIKAGDLNSSHLEQLLRDPQEPDYNNYHCCAKVIPLKGGAIGISSFAHGYRVYTIEGDGDGDHDSKTEGTIGEIPWECLSSHLEQLGFWKTQELGKNEAEQAKVDSLIEEMKVNPNIKYSGSRSVQGSEKQDGYTLHTFAVFNPLMNLDFNVTKMIESPDGGMIELKVRQKQGDRVKTQKALIKSTDTTKVDTFVNALKKAIGRNLVCNLKPPHLQALLQNRTAQYQIAGGKTFRLAPRTGRQDDGFWVFENIQFNPKGEICTEDESLWMFNPSLGVDEQVVSPKIAPQNKDALLNLIKAAQNYYHAETFPLALITIGYGVATVHRDYIYEAYSSLPQMNVFGDAGGGKTLAAIMASSLFGTHIAPVSRFTESVIFETVKSIGSLLLVIDDPLKKERRGGDLAVKVDNFVWDMYGTNARKVRGNEQKPHTNVIITSNKAIGEDTAAIESRLIKVSFPKREFNQFGRHAVSDAIAGATGGLGQLIGMKFDNQAIKKVALQLTPHLTGAHARLTDSYAILTHYTQRLCDLAGFEFNALEYCINNLCPKANTFESDKCSLTDFLEKLATLRTKGVVGEWDVSQVKKRGHKSFLAINMVSVWPIFEREYPHVNYSRQSIEALISERGGANKSSQKFIESKAVWLDYQRALNQYRMAGGQGAGDKSLEPIKPSKAAVARCSLIPTAIVDEAIGGEDATTTNYSDNTSPSWEPTPPTAEETTPTPDEVKVGDYATVRVNLPEVELKAGDRVVIVEVQQDQESGVWFAIARSDNQGKRFSLWLNDLQATGQVADPSG